MEIILSSHHTAVTSPTTTHDLRPHPRSATRPALPPSSALAVVIASTVLLLFLLPASSGTIAHGGALYTNGTQRRLVLSASGHDHQALTLRSARLCFETAASCLSWGGDHLQINSSSGSAVFGGQRLDAALEAALDAADAAAQRIQANLTRLTRQLQSNSAGSAALTTKSVSFFNSFSGCDIWRLQGVTHLYGSLNVTGCPDLRDLSDVAELRSIAGSLDVVKNPALRTLAGLEQITRILPGAHLDVRDNPSLESLAAFNALTSVGTWFDLDNNDKLRNLSGLNSLATIGGFFDLERNLRIEHLDDLSSLTSVGNFLDIDSNSALTNLDGLSSLSVVGGFLSVQGNPTLTGLTGLNGLGTVGGAFIHVCHNALVSSIPTALTGLASGKFHSCNVQCIGACSCSC